jgi:hypothetical protein
MLSVSMRNHPLPRSPTQQEKNLTKIHTKIYYTVSLYNLARRRVLFLKKQSIETSSAIY